MGTLLSWWLAVEVLGLVTLPLAGVLFSNLPDRGLALSKPLGLITLGWLIWFPLATISALPYNGVWIAGTFVLFAAGNAALLRDPARRDALRRLVTRERAYIIASEALFAGSFALMAFVRSFTPEVKDTEKFMDVAFLSALWRSPHLPAPDPWLSGQPINYYYFGHYLMATLAKLLGTQPGTAFNVAVALVFALTAVAVFGVAANIAAVARRREVALARALPAGLASALLVLVLGNLNGAQIWWQNAHALVQGAHGLLANPWAWWLHRDLWLGYDWWSPSRVIPLVSVSGGSTINEFPAFSFVLADLHAHVLALPFAALAAGIAFSLLLARGEGVRAFGQGLSGLLALVTAGVAIGALYAINGWDLPTYLGLALLALALQQWLAHGRRLSGLFAVDFGSVAMLLVAIALLAYLPFYRGYVAPTQGIAVVAGVDRSPIGDEFAIFGLQIFLVGSLLVLWLVRWATARITAATAHGDAPEGDLASRLRGYERPAGMALVGVPLALLLLWTQATRGNLGWTLFWSLLIVLVCAALAIRLLRAKDVSAEGGASDDGGQASQRPDGVRQAELWVLCLIATSAALVAVSELIFLRDIFSTRMNTVFKLYYQAWLLLGIACGPALVWLLAAARRGLAWLWAPALAHEARPAIAPRGALACASAAGTAARQTSIPAGSRIDRLKATRPVDGIDATREGERPGRAAGQPRTPSRPPNIPAALRRLGAGGILLWIAALVTLLAAALVYPVLATSARTANFSLPRSLDGTAYMATDPVDVPAACNVAAGSNHDDNEAIAWLNANISGSPVIVEAPGCEWSHYSRISSFTGLPTLLGWPGGHEGEWRAGWLTHYAQDDIFAQRLDTINQIYTDTDPAAVMALLRQYQVHLVYVGVAERALYANANLDRFKSFLRVIYSRDGITIYEVPA